MKRLVFAFALLATPVLAQQQPPGPEAYLEQMVGNLAGQIAKLQATIQQKNAQIEELQKQLAEQKK